MWTPWPWAVSSWPWLVALVVGAVQLTASMNQYNQELEMLTELKRENAKLEHAYRTALDLDTVQEKAEAMGMVPAEEAEKMTVRVSVPEHEEEPTAWENFLWFLSGWARQKSRNHNLSGHAYTQNGSCEWAARDSLAAHFQRGTLLGAS